MRRIVAIAVVALGLASCGGGGSSATPVQNPPPPPSPSQQLATDLAGLQLEDFYEESFKALIYRSPESIVWNALTGIYPLAEIGLDDLSDAHRRETYAMYQVVLDALQTYDRSTLTPAGQDSFDFYEWYLQDFIDSLQFIYHEFVATYNFSGVQRGTEQFFTQTHPMATLDDAQNYVTRLSAIETKFRDVTEYLSLQSGAGIVEPVITLDVAIFLLGEIADGNVDGNLYFTDFVTKLNSIAGVSDTDRQNLIDSARTAVQNDVIPAYQDLRRKLQELRPNAPANVGVGQYPSGQEFYSYKLRHRTTTDMTAEEIHQLGLDELARIHAEMRVLFDQLGYPQNETLAQLFNRVVADGGVIPAADVKPTYENIVAAAEAAVGDAFDIFPSANVIVADDDFGGFYIGPSFDGTRPGAFYAGTQNNEAYFAMPSLAYHEAVPGHHTQIAIAMDQQDGPVFRRIVRFTAFVEGWALYAERLAFELGWYDGDVYGNLGRLQFEALRAARLVMDTGIHSLGWTFEQAVQFNMDNVGASRGSSEGAAGRYSVVPAQATAYMIGMLHILQLRQRAMDELGSKFDLKDFHRAVLTSGGVPLPVLDAVIDRYISDTLNGP